MENDLTLPNRVITGDKIWFFQYESETERQRQQWLPSGLSRLSQNEQIKG